MHSICTPYACIMHSLCSHYTPAFLIYVVHSWYNPYNTTYAQLMSHCALLMHSICTPYAHIMHSLCNKYARLMHTLMHSLCSHYKREFLIHIISFLYTPHTLLMYSYALLMHSVCTHYAQIMHSFCSHYILALRMRRCTLLVHSLYTIYLCCASSE